ncbi:MAG: hypothetical protein JWQ18_577 [Conexibacter sp.]|nr:hypothetical protein [Conexibacter sp.]
MPRPSPRRSRRAGGAAAILAACLVALPALAAPGSIAATKRCSSGQVKRTVTYKSVKDRRRHTVTACGPRGPLAPGLTAAGSSKGVVASVLRQSRRFAAAAAPARVAHLLRGRPARRVGGADAVTDAAADRWFAILNGDGPLAHAATPPTTTP